MNDINGIKLEVGDLIIYARFSSLLQGVVLGLTEKSVKISCLRGKSYWRDGKWDFSPDKNGSIHFEDRNPYRHNSYKYQPNYLLYNKYNDMSGFIIVKKNINIPESLERFCRR